MTAYDRILETLETTPRSWLVTGCAGFIGSHLLEQLLRAKQRVVGLDNFATGFRRNLDDVRSNVGEEKWSRFGFIEGDITNSQDCARACEGVDFVLHQAALGSVPRSIGDPLATHRANVDGFLQMLIAARNASVRRFVYASSSSVYGDEASLPKVEERVGRPLSPYATSKAINESYADVFHLTYGTEVVGLRYFNVFGPRQDPEGPYAAVIPRWVSQLLDGTPCLIYGDGETSRDFCYVANAVQANILSAATEAPGIAGEVFNVSVGARTTLNELFVLLRDGLAGSRLDLSTRTPEYGPFREGDVRHSLAAIDKAASLLGYAPTHSLVDGLGESLDWYAANLSPSDGSQDPASA